MRVTIKRLRIGIVVLAAALMLALFLFFAYARYQMRRIGKDLPAKLGLQVQQSGNVYAVTHYDKKGHPVFTVHAAKEIRFKDGRASLHDVGITLYGPNGDRADRISGDDFDYDQASGVASAKGEVQIDLTSPAAGSKASGQPPPQQSGQSADDDAAAAQTIHVKTSGLTFSQKTGVATTEQAVEFRLPKAAGKAVGATYDSQLGLLVLNHEVEIISSSNGAPLEVRASHAQFDRDSREAYLQHASTEFQNEHFESDQATVYFRPDGSAEHIDARGAVRIETEGGQDLRAQSAMILLDKQSQPRRADLGGGLVLVSEDKVHHMNGSAAEGSFDFVAGSLHHAQLRNAVNILDQEAVLPNAKSSSSRAMRASKLDIDFAAAPGKRVLAQKALAVGDASAVFRTVSAAGSQSTTVAADQLLATLANGNVLSALNGAGHTSLTTVSTEGVKQTSTGDRLDVSFAPVAAHPAKAGSDKVTPGKAGPDKASPGKAGRNAPSPPDLMATATSRLQSAVQQGNVTLTQTPAQAVAPGKTAAAPLHASAQRAEYHAGDQILRLTGSPRFSDGSLDLSANAIDLNRESGNATATGDVKATYLQAANGKNSANGPSLGTQGPVHVIAADAALSRATGDATFRGQARLWQGTNSVAAPTIELSRTQQVLKAHAEEAASQVNAAFATVPDPKQRQAVIRVRSRELVYSEAERVARFRGSVVAEETAGTIHSDQADVFLVPSSAPGQKSGESQIDHLVAAGHVLLAQPGRQGVGEKLIYTQQDGRCVLTGTSSASPRLSDQAHGTVTGVSLIFNTRDDSVSVNGGQSGAVTETRVPR